MLKLPVNTDHDEEDSVEGDKVTEKESVEGSENNNVTKTIDELNSAGISFGFDGHLGEPDSSSTTSPDSSHQQLDAQESTLTDVKKKAGYVALEIAGLVSSLRTTVQDASELTRAHAQVQKQVCDEVELIVETGVKCSDQLLAKVMDLSSRLDNLDDMKKNIDKIDVTLARYEKVAKSLIERRQKSRALKLEQQSIST